MAQRLREVEHAEAQVVDARQRGQVAGDVEAGAALDHQAQRHALVASRMYAGRSPIRWPYSGRPAPNERLPSGAKYVAVDQPPRIVERLHVRCDDAAHAAVEKAGDRRGRDVRHARDRREVVALGGEAPRSRCRASRSSRARRRCRRTAGPTAASTSMTAGAANVRWTPRMRAPLAAASLTALAFMVDRVTPAWTARQLHELGQEQVGILFDHRARRDAERFDVRLEVHLHPLRLQEPERFLLVLHV